VVATVAVVIVVLVSDSVVRDVDNQAVNFRKPCLFFQGV